MGKEDADKILSFLFKFRKGTYLMKKITKVIAAATALSAALGVCAYAAEDTIEDKVIAGSQAWFNTEGDGSPRNEWVHWGRPEVGHLTFDAYPDVRDYSVEDLKETYFAELGNGEKSKLFSSYRAGVIDKHFEMMHDYGIDGVAVQRFGSVTINGVEERFKNSVDILKNVKASAEKHNELFYVMYDISGLSEENLVEDLKADWQQVILNDLDITSSPSYAKDNGRPVVCLWGLGIREGTGEQYSELIDWFHDKGCYVIGGVSKSWRDQIAKDEAMEKAFCKLDMLSPWSVGSAKTDSDVDSDASILAADKAYLDEKGIAYQPVMFPGFSWSNWKDNAVRNQIPRRAGDFMWRQAYNIAKQDIHCGYIAMFDEYDEGTAILKLAEDSSMIPKDQYFITASADGSYTSSDLYMRLAGYIPKVLRGEEEITEEMPLLLSEGPVYFRSGFEKYFDAQPVDGNGELVKDELTYNGRYALKLNRVGGGGEMLTKLSELDFSAEKINIGISAYLAGGSAELSVGLETADGDVLYSDLSFANGKWTYNTLTDISVAGKNITGLILKAKGTDDYKIYIDDVIVTEDASLINSQVNGSKYDLYARNLYNLGLLDGENADKFVMNLENEVTREQAVKAIIGVLGEKADDNAENPFTDLSSWAVPYVSKAYEMGIAVGTGDKTFSAKATITKREATAILLRALGYQGDAYANCEKIAVESGLYKDESMCVELDSPITYDELVFLSYRALFTNPYQTNNVLLGSLLQKGVIKNEQLNKETDVLEEYNMSLEPPARIIFNEDYFYNLMNITLNTDPTKGDSYTKSELKKETACVFIPENQYMYCQISDTYIAPEDNRVKVTITYLDEGTGEFGIHYNSSDEAFEGNARNYKNSMFEPRTNSGEWKTQSVVLEDASFNNKQNNGADMRVFGPDIYIREIAVEKL